MNFNGAKLTSILAGAALNAFFGIDLMGVLDRALNGAGGAHPGAQAATLTLVVVNGIFQHGFTNAGRRA